MKKHLLTLIICCSFGAAGFSQPDYVINLKETFSVLNAAAEEEAEAEIESVLADDFAKNKGKLPWPVDNGYVSIPFGKYSIGDTKLKGNNPGITIATRKTNAPVKTVFDGTVSSVDNQGEVTTVFIRHGKYHTVYSNLSDIDVQVGDVVKKGQIIGSAGESCTGSGTTGELSFLIMSGLMNVNPITWLRHH
jgi:murein DD-endopeptidase MepM/ murein hydrolase activator NlpD